MALLEDIYLIHLTAGMAIALYGISITDLYKSWEGWADVKLTWLVHGELAALEGPKRVLDQILA